MSFDIIPGNKEAKYLLLRVEIMDVFIRLDNLFDQWSNNEKIYHK
jgi:hypothetical protein